MMASNKIASVARLPAAGVSCGATGCFSSGRPWAGLETNADAGEHGSVDCASLKADIEQHVAHSDALFKTYDACINDLSCSVASSVEALKAWINEMKDLNHARSEYERKCGIASL